MFNIAVLLEINQQDDYRRRAFERTRIDVEVNPPRFNFFLPSLQSWQSWVALSLSDRTEYMFSWLFYCHYLRLLFLLFSIS